MLHGKIFLLGPGRAGKSALMRALLRQEFKRNLKSTIGIDFKRASCFAQTCDGRIIFKNEKNSVQQHVLQACKSLPDLLKKGLNTGKQGDGLAAFLGPQRNADDGTPCNGTSTVPDIDHDKLAMFSGFLDNLLSLTGARDADACIDMWDFAGQKPFQILGHMFLDKVRCCFIVAFDATKLKAGVMYEDVFCDENGEDQILKTGFTTYVAAFESWLNLIHQIVGNEDDTPVYAVGTHIDEFQPEERDEKLKEVESFIWSMTMRKAYNCNLKKIFFLSNTTSGTPYEDVQLEALRTEVYSQARTHFSADIPLKWLRFAAVNQHIMQTLQQNVISLDAAHSIIRENCRDRDLNIDVLLSYYQSLGQILQYGGSRDVTPFPDVDTKVRVIVDTEWLMLAAAVLFTPPSRRPLFQAADSRYRDQYESLFTKGILFESLAKHRWQQDERTKELASNAEKRIMVIKLLGQYGVLYDTNEDAKPAPHLPECRKYLVPSLVQRLPRVPRSADSQRQTPSYYIACEVGQLFPEITFWCSVVRLMQVYRSRSLDLALYNAQARLIIHDRYQLRLEHFSRGIRLVMEDEVDGDQASLARESRGVLDKVLDTVHRLVECTLPHMVVFQAVPCSCEKADDPCVAHDTPRCSRPDCLHFAPLRRDSNVLRCPLLDDDPAVVACQEKLQKFWLPANIRMVS